MEIEVKIDKSLENTKVVIYTPDLTCDINSIIQSFSSVQPTVIAGTLNDKVEVLNELEISRLFSEDKKIYAKTPKGDYLIKMRLYELEDRLDKSIFVRISNSEIINIKQVKNFDLNFSGTICVTMKDGSSTYVSRRNVIKIKQLLGM